jgi:transcriptional regulator with PAS, ATPase and Fis domain
MQMDTDECGVEVLKETKLKKIHSIILSSYDNDEITEKSYLNGCQHFLTKIHYIKSLPSYLKNFINSRSVSEVDYITNDAKLLCTLQNLKSLNLSEQSIFINGETGVGKSLIGKAIHRFSHFDFNNFVHLNCAEVSEDLLESTLFGHKKGSFTGAIEDKKGLLEVANGGTLFLDEIATMPTHMQQKLLKALDEKTFYPLGSNTAIKSSFTLITATCEDLFDLIAKGKFRKDLFFRISGFNIEIPPLRDRKEDIKDLIKLFSAKLQRKIVFKECALDKLSAYSWPGNIRELKKVIDLLSQEKSGVIDQTSVQKYLNSNSNNADRSYLTTDQKTLITDMGLRSFIKKIEQEIVKESLSRNKGKITHTIKELKISSSAFYRVFENLSLS